MFTGISTLFEVHRRHHLKSPISLLGPFLDTSRLAPQAGHAAPRAHSDAPAVLTARHSRRDFHNTLLKQRLTPIIGSEPASVLSLSRHSQKPGISAVF